MSFGTEQAAARRDREQLDPADFELVGEYYLGDNPEICDAYAGAMPADEDHELTGKCEHCGTYHLYGALYRDTRDDSRLAVGNNCASNFFSFESKLKYKVANAKKLAAARKRREKVQAEAEAFLADHPGLAEALEADHHIVANIKHKLFKNGSLSEKQIELVEKIAREVAEREAAKANEPQPQPIPAELLDGRVKITGTALGFKEVESQWGITVKVLVQDDRGFKVFGTNPGVGRGDKISFMARV